MLAITVLWLALTNSRNREKIRWLNSNVKRLESDVKQLEADKAKLLTERSGLKSEIRWLNGNFEDALVSLLESAPQAFERRGVSSDTTVTCASKNGFWCTVLCRNNDGEWQIVGDWDSDLESIGLHTVDMKFSE